MAFERGVVYGPAQLFHRLVRFLTQTEDATWQPNTFFPRGTIIRPIPGYRFVCVQEGTTGSSPPNWNSIASKQGVMYKQTINDGSCIWQVLSTTFSPGWDYTIDFSDLFHRRLFFTQLQLSSLSIPNLLIPYPVVEFEFFYDRPVNEDIGIWYSAGSSHNFVVFMTSANQRFEFSFHDSGGNWRPYVSNISFTQGQSYIVKVEYTGNQVRFYINNELRQTISVGYAVQTRSNARFVIVPALTSPTFSHYIRWIKVYDQNQLLCHWNLELFGNENIYNQLAYLNNLEIINTIHTSSSDNSIIRIAPLFSFNQVNPNDYLTAVFNSNLVLIGKNQSELYRPAVRLDVGYSSNSYYSVNLAGSELYRHFSGWRPDFGLPVWNVLTPTEYFIQGNNSYFQVVTKTGDATHYFYFGEYYPFYPSNLIGFVPITIFSFQRANQHYMTTPNFNTAILNYSQLNWISRTDFTRFTSFTLVPLEGIYRPVFSIVIGDSSTPYGQYYNLFYVLGQGLSLMTYLDDGAGNDYIVFREITNNAWHQWYAIKIE